MGVYIKEYRKPQTCGGCEFFKPWIHDRGDDSFCPLAVKETKASDRPTWCPIVEVKSHGRLIDADALNELIDSGDDIDFSETPKTKYALMQMVNEQDTILEACPYRYKMIGKTDKPHGIYFIESEENK